MNNIFTIAQKTIEDKQQWSSGESVTLHENGEGFVYLAEGGRDGGCELYLWYQTPNRTNSASVKAGQLMFPEGWVFTLTQGDYARWADKAQRKANGDRQAKERREAGREALKPHNRYPPRKKNPMYK